MGEPLPNEDKQQEIDFDTMEEFEFLFDIALAPEFKAEVCAEDKVDYYTIEVTDEWWIIRSRLTPNVTASMTR